MFRLVSLPLAGGCTGDHLTRDPTLSGMVCCVLPRRVVNSDDEAPGGDISRRSFLVAALSGATPELQPGMPVRVYEFRKAWTTACEKAGIEGGKAGRIFHDLRRTGVRNLRRAGVDRKVAMAISGHRTEAVFERYNIETDEDLREAVGKLSSYVNGLPAAPIVVPIRDKV